MLSHEKGDITTPHQAVSTDDEEINPGEPPASTNRATDAQSLVQLRWVVTAPSKHFALNTLRPQNQSDTAVTQTKRPVTFGHFLEKAPLTAVQSALRDMKESAPEPSAVPIKKGDRFILPHRGKHALANKGSAWPIRAPLPESRGQIRTRKGDDTRPMPRAHAG